MMPVTPLGVRTPSTGIDAAGGTLAGRQDDFASVIARARTSAPAGGEEAAKAARESAQEFVAVSLVQPLLQKLRESNQAAAPFAPSSGEKQFRQMLDAQISQRIVRASSFGIVDGVARSLMRNIRDTGSKS